MPNNKTLATLLFFAFTVSQGCEMQDFGSDIDLDEHEAIKTLDHGTVEDRSDGPAAERIVTLTDDHNNQVMLRITAGDESIIRQFLESNDLSIEALSNFAIPPAEDALPDFSNNGREEEDPNALALSIEVLSQEFGPDTPAFSLNVKRSDQLPDDVTISSFTVTYTSPKRYDGFHFWYTAVHHPYSNQSLTAEHLSRKKCDVFSCVYRHYATYGLSRPGYYVRSCKTANRTRLRVTTPYSTYLYSYSFQFYRYC